VDLSIDPGLKSHLIAFPSLEEADASSRTFIQLEYNEYTNHINHKKMSLCLIASKWSIINRSLRRSQFKVSSDRFSICRIATCIYCNHCLSFYFFFKEVLSNCNSSIDTFNFGTLGQLCSNFGLDQYAKRRISCGNYQNLKNTHRGHA
jgi:hypothetical protein